MINQSLLPRFEMLSPKILAGQHLNMSLANNRTFELWSRFMPQRKEIPNPVGNDLYSAEVYPKGFFDQFNPLAGFEKWAAIEISEDTLLPGDVDTLLLPGGLYAVFTYRGAASEAVAAYQYIYSTWLPGSGYSLAQRPHFALMGEKYRHESPDSEEEIWIPVDADM